MMAAAATGPGADELPRASAKARYVRSSPRKVRRVIELIRGRDAGEALTLLRFAQQAAAEPVAKVLASAMANAENNLSVDPDTLVVSKVYVDEGPTLKRIRPRAQGRGYRIRKRTSHITVEVTSMPVVRGPRKASKTAARAGRSGVKGSTR